MKSVRSLYGVCAVLTACCLLTAVIAALQFFEVAEGLSLNGWTLISLFFLGLLITGIIWLGLDWFSLNIAVSSFIQRFQQDTNEHSTNIQQTLVSEKNLFNALKAPLSKELNEILNKYLFQEQKTKEVLKKQIENLRLKLTLAENQKTNIQAIIFSLRDAVIVIDEYDKLLMANETAGRVLGFDYKKDRHKNLEKVVSDDKKPFVEMLRNSRQSKVEHKKSEIQLHVGGQNRCYDCIISCVRDNQGNVCGVASVLHDISREKEISRQKSGFVGHVSHELKTPLASITAYAEMLMDDEAKDENMQKEFCSVIHNQAQRLNRLIENILNISRIESGLIKIEKIPVSLTILIEEQLGMIRGYAEEKNIKITAQQPIIFDRVYVDKDMISQVIVNLLSNAVKYTPSGGEVRIESEVDENEEIVRVTVSDTGAGIPQKDIEHIFDKFYRVEENKDKAGGTGLGLNLVKTIIESVHGGRVFVYSEVGIGSTFGFELPLCKTSVLESV